MKLKQPWLHTALADSIFILAPPFLCLLAVLLFPGFFQQTNNEVTVEAWVILVLLIDVGHVYSTLFRTYFDKETFAQNRRLFLYAPLCAFLLSVLLYSFGSLVFWRVLAYLAVFHFVRQQYGFMQLYSRREIKQPWERLIDKIMIYSATLFPILYWHLDGNRNFSWFLQGDFMVFKFPEILPQLTSVYLGLCVLFVLKEIRFSVRNKQVNIPRNLVISGTALSWYLGIIHFNGDLTFTLFNVVSHGIPYLALVWFYGKRNQARTSVAAPSKLLTFTFSGAGILLFIGIISGLAFLEEGLWDAFVWQEHTGVFAAFWLLPAINNEVFLNFLIPVLALPQLTHYLLDGFIWKVSRDKNLS